jgi:raffinose synthase
MVDLTQVFSDVPNSVTVLAGTPAEGLGAFIRFAGEKAAARHEFSVGVPVGWERFTACHRYEPFWMTAKAGTTGAEVTPETQHLLARRASDCVLLVPLVDGAFRCALEGREDGSLVLVAESGDGATVTDAVTGLYVAVGPDPFALMANGAREIADFLGIGRPRAEKPVPEFADQFGWCTWDAFYGEVSHEKVREGLESFKAGGVTPKYLILDDGWQSVRARPTGERRLSSFAANEKFPGDLKPTVDMAKGEYGVETFLVWHAVGGYWGGADADALPRYGVRSQARQYSAGINHYVPELVNWFGTACGVVPADCIYRFYQDYHRHLREQGVDGVKVDNQASLEGLAQGHGGRVSLMRSYREALEGSVAVHFGGNLINCMSCANEMLFSALASNLTRTSTDFWPKKPESHGLHLYVNAQVSAFWGEFVHPDWDMFQSGHEMGAYHAAGRAVGGCPVYVSDKPGAHDFDVLKKLVLPDGRVLRCDGPGRPTADCLFHDPTKEDVLLKIWNLSRGNSGVVGVFHARYGEGVGAISGSIRPCDIAGWAELLYEIKPFDSRLFAVYAHQSREMRLLKYADEWAITLDPLGWEVFTVTVVEHGVAPIGLTNYLNTAMTADLMTPEEGSNVRDIYLESVGEFVAYCSEPPVAARVFDQDVPFRYDPITGRLDASVNVDRDGSLLLTLTLPEAG